jgi:hypothetical protein
MPEKWGECHNFSCVIGGPEEAPENTLATPLCICSTPGLGRLCSKICRSKDFMVMFR